MIQYPSVAYTVLINDRSPDTSFVRLIGPKAMEIAVRPNFDIL
jgi:hypothetical protein